MAISKTPIAVLASVSVPAGGTKTSPQAAGVGPAIDLRNYAGGDLGYSLTNGASAPGAAPTLSIQDSPDGTKWYDYQIVGGDTVASSFSSGTISIDRKIMYVRVVVYGHTTNAVTAEASLQAEVG